MRRAILLILAILLTTCRSQASIEEIPPEPGVHRFNEGFGVPTTIDVDCVDCTEVYFIERVSTFIITDGEGNTITLPGPLVIEVLGD